MLDDADADRVAAIAAEDGAIFLSAEFHARDVAEADDNAVLALGDHELGEFLRCTERALDAGREDQVLRGQRACRRLDVFGPHGAFDVADGEAARGDGAAIKPHAHGRRALAADLDTGDAVDGGEAVDQIAFGIVGQFKRGALVAHQLQPQHDLFGRVSLLHVWRIGFFRQLAEHAADAVAHVVGGRVHVARDVELDGDGRLAVLARRVDEANAFDAGDAVLDHLGDAGLDHVGGGAGIGRADRDDRRVDVRIFAQGKARERDKADRDQQQADHGGEDRSFD